MGRRQVRGPRWSARTPRHGCRSRQFQKPSLVLPRPRYADRKSLLLGSALASTLLIGSLLAPAPAFAVVNCPAGTGPAPLSYLNQTDDIVCLNTEPRDGGAGGGIELQTIVGAYYIDVTNTATGTLTGGIGIAAETQASGSPISIDNAATIDTVARGIEALALGSFSPVIIVNSGAITAALGIFAGSTSDSPITITNSGRLDTELGIEAESEGDNSDIVIRHRRIHNRPRQRHHRHQYASDRGCRRQRCPAPDRQPRQRHHGRQFWPSRC